MRSLSKVRISPVRIAYSSISGGAMLRLWVAKDKGLFDKYGVEIERTYIRDAAIEALLPGQVKTDESALAQ